MILLSICLVGEDSGENSPCEQRDIAVGLDDTSCRMLVPRLFPWHFRGTPRAVAWPKRWPKRAKGQNSLLAKM